MLDGFQYVLGQIGVVLVITALLAAVLGWFLGRGSRRRGEEALERAIAAVARPATDASAFAPSEMSSSTSEISSAEGSDATPELDGDDEFPTHRLPYGVALIDSTPLHDAESATVVRPAPGETRAVPEDATVLRPPVTTVLRAHEGTVIRHVDEGTVLRAVDEGTVIRPAEDGTLIRPQDDGTVLRPAPVGTVIRPAATPYDSGTVIRSVPGVTGTGVDTDVPTAEESTSVPPELRENDLQLGVIEAAALAAWDRTVPMLQQQLKDLATQNDELRHLLRDAQERLDSDGTAHLRAVSVESRAAERRARA